MWGVTCAQRGRGLWGGVLRMDLKGWGAKWPGSPKSAHVVTPGVHRGPVGPAGPSPRSAPTKLFWVRPGPRAWAGTQRVEGRRLETGPLNMPGGEVRFPEPSRRSPCPPLSRPHLRAVLPSIPVAHVSATSQLVNSAVSKPLSE